MSLPIPQGPGLWGWVLGLFSWPSSFLGGFKRRKCWTWRRRVSGQNSWTVGRLRFVSLPGECDDKNRPSAERWLTASTKPVLWSLSCFSTLRDPWSCGKVYFKTSNWEVQKERWLPLVAQLGLGRTWQEAHTCLTLVHCMMVLKLRSMKTFQGIHDPDHFKGGKLQILYTFMFPVFKFISYRSHLWWEHRWLCLPNSYLSSLQFYRKKKKAPH